MRKCKEKENHSAVMQRGMLLEGGYLGAKQKVPQGDIVFIH